MTRDAWMVQMPHIIVGKLNLYMVSYTCKEEDGVRHTNRVIYMDHKIRKFKNYKPIEYNPDPYGAYKLMDHFSEYNSS